MEKLWTKNFTIITLGTVVSMLGNAIAGFAIGLMILDYSGSVLLYALALVANNLPKLVMPLVAGVFLDNFSRIKSIYILDFISCLMYLGAGFVLGNGWFSYPFFLVYTFILGSIDSTYAVAYDSLYPTLVSEGNFRRAYSVSSLLYPLSMFMVPVAAWGYENFGLAPLFYFNSATFLVAALFETQIKSTENHLRTGKARITKSIFRDYFKEGIDYIKGEPGLWVITLYFGINTLTWTASDVVRLPYFKSNPELGVVLYTLVMGAGVLGRFVGGIIHYKIKYPTNKKLAIALFVYISISIIEGTYLFLPIWGMVILMFISGITSVTSYNIRISATQSYVPNNIRARFNGVFQMFCMCGTVGGQLLAGLMGDFIPARAMVVIFSAVNLISSLAIIYRGREKVRPIYNRDL